MINDLLIALAWYLVLTGFGVIVLPLSMTVFRRMPEGGILLSRPLGWLLLGFLSWWFAFLRILPFSYIGIGIIGIALFAASIYMVKQRPGWFQRKWKIHWRTAFNGEFLAVLAFLLILLARREDPNINSTEKPMDIMMLNSLVTATTMPPGDAWLSGHTINYHYAGYLLHSIPIQLTGIQPEIGYNMAFPTVIFLGVAIAFVLGRMLFGRCRWAALTPVCIFFIGNLAGLTGFLQRIKFGPNLHDWRFGFLWNSSRVIHDAGGSTINEYPLFAVLWGDLHPHFSNIPFLLLFIALTYALYRSMMLFNLKKMLQFEWPLILIAAAASGFILPTNVFDFPIASLFFGLFISAGLLHRLWNAGERWNEVLPSFVLVLIPIVGYALALPFWSTFIPPDQGTQVKICTEHSKFSEFVLVFGLHIAASIGFLFLRGRRMWVSGYRDETSFSLGLIGIFFVALWAKFGFLACALAPSLALVFWLFAFRTVFQKNGRTGAGMNTELFALVACALAWSMIAGCEFIYLKDSYGISRMNTIFKFHFPAWFLFGLGLPYLLYHDYWRSERSVFQWFVLLPVLGIFLLSLIPPVYALTWIYNMQDNDPVTMNGLASVQKDRPQHYAIIEWIRINTNPDDRILEVPGCGYRFESTISAFTGRPTLVGWVGHEALWRTGEMDTEVYNRKDEAKRFYTTRNWEEAKAILKKHNIKYVTYITPECDETRSMTGLMESSVFRSHLKPIITGQGQMGYRIGRMELYEVPESL